MKIIQSALSMILLVSGALISALIPLTSGIAADPPPDTARFPDGQSQLYRANKTLGEYLDHIQTNNLESAVQYWAPSALQRSERLGLSYDGVRIKADISSPAIKSARFKPEMALKSGRPLDSIFTMLDVSATVDGEILRYHYYVAEYQGYPWLVFPQDYYCHDWPVRESRYFRFHINPVQLPFVSDVALAELDTFVDSTAVRLGISLNRLVHLADEKIDYYFCRDESEVKRVTGDLGEAQGRFDLASDALFSESLAHFHEVAHILINYRLQTLPINTLPFLKEGVATLYGGRAGLAAPGLLDMAAFLYMNDQIALDSLFELMSFHNSSDASLAYPGAALFLKSIIDAYGMDKFLELYRSLSGTFSELKRLTVSDIHNRISEVYGVSWNEILRRFEGTYVTGRFRESTTYPRLAPGALSGGEPEQAINLKSARVEEFDGRVYVTGLRNGTGGVRGSIIFGKLANAPARSKLFEDQFGPDFQYPGYRYGIRFDDLEAGLYDYATSTLLAKHLSGFADGAEYHDPADSTVSFSFPLDLCHGVSPIPDAQILED